MIPYILLMFVPLLFSFFKISKRNEKYIVAFGRNREIMDHSWALPVFFLLLMIILSLRGVSVGTDLKNYQYYFERITLLDFQELSSVDLDGLFVLLIWVVGKFTDSFQLFLAIIAVITVLPVAMLYCQDREHGFLKIVLLMNMSTFVMLFSGLRQSIALAIGVIAYEFVKKKKPFSFLLCVLVAFGIHHTAFMMLLYYPLYHYTFKKKHLWFVIPGVIFVFLFNKSIFEVATSFLSQFLHEKYTTEIQNTGAYTMLLLFIAFAAVAYILPDEKALDKETLGLRNFLVLAVVLQCFSPIHTLAMRLNYYFIMFIPVLMPKLLKPNKVFNHEFVFMVKSVMVVFFAGYYLLTTYVSCQTGISALDTYPYVPFWG